MKEDIAWRLLKEFDPQSYIQALHVGGRAKTELSLRLQASGLHEYLATYRLGQEAFLSSELTAILALVERVLVSEYLLLRTGGVPRYASYTNVRVLNWSLRNTDRTSLAEIRNRCWFAIRLLLQDLLSFEIRSIAGVAETHQDQMEAGKVALRISGLRKLIANTPNVGTSIEPRLYLDDPPKDWASYALDDTRSLALLHLSAFPQTDHHDEMLFIRTIHVSECCYWGAVAAIRTAIDHAYLGRVNQATACLDEATAFVGFLIPLFQIFKSTMSREQFCGFRDATGDASAIQSRTFQLLEIHTRGLDEEKARLISGIPELTDLLHFGHPSFVPLGRLACDIQESGIMGGAAFYQKCEELDRKLIAWKGIHLGIAAENLPPESEGTGKTGGIDYLKIRFKLSMFSKFTPFNFGTGHQLYGTIPARPVFSALN